MATIRDVARQAGVSSSTVSLTFNDANRVSNNTAKKVWDAANELGYRPNPLAQSLSRGRSNLLGIVVADLSNPFAGVLLREIEFLANKAGFNVLVTQSDGKQQQELDVLDHLASLRVAGIILFAHGSDADYCEALEQIDVPIVTVDQKVDKADFDFVCSNNRLAASMLTEHLLQLGHTRITQISGPPHLWTAAERIAGFRATMAAAGFADAPVVNGNYSVDESYDKTMELMTQKQRPTAILAANNVIGLGCLSAIQGLGFKCPEDLSIVAIDNLPWSEIFQPRITVVEQDQKSLAQQAIAYLLERVDASQPFSGAGRETVLVPKLVIGNSTQKLNEV